MTSRLLCSLAVLAALASAGPKVVYTAGVPCDESGRRLVQPTADPPGDTVYSFPVPRTWPVGLARQDDWFWSCDLDVDSIYRLDSTGVVDASFQAPGNGCGGMEWTGTDLWFVSESDARLYRLDTATCAVLDSFTLPDSAAGDPNSWGLAWDGQYLWHSQYGTRARIFKLDPATGAVLYSFRPPVLGILGITWDNDYLCGVDIGGDMLYRMDPSDSSVVDSTPWLLPYALGLDWDGSCFWNVEGDFCRVYRIDGYTGTAEPVPGPATHAPGLRLEGPSPFTRSTMVCCTSPHGTPVEVQVVDCSGRVIRVLASDAGTAGGSRLAWDGTDRHGRRAGSGVYFFRLALPGGAGTATPVLLAR